MKNPIIQKINFGSILIILYGFILFSCDEDDTLLIGQKYMEERTYLNIIDTFTVEMSTVLVDSLPTSQSEEILLGGYSDTCFGTVRCNTFFQLGLPSSPDVDNEDIYDSITLILEYNGYWYGDTMNTMEVFAYELTEELEYDDEIDDEYLYTNSDFEHDNTPLGSLTFRPLPGATDSIIEIKLDDALGEEFFEKLMDSDDEMDDEDVFLYYFKGIALVTSTDSKSVVAGFKAGEDDVVMRIYSHRINEDVDTIETDFPIINTDLQFTQIVYDFSGTNLEDLKNQRNAINASLLGEKSYLQAGTGLMTRLRFPSLPDYFFLDQGVLMKAELVLYPVVGTYSDFELSDTLILYETDAINRFGDPLYTSGGDLVVPTLTLDENYNAETYYTFDITNFLDDEFEDSYYDVEHGILVSLPTDILYTTLERVIFSNNDLEPVLRIYYLTY